LIAILPLDVPNRLTELTDGRRRLNCQSTRRLAMIKALIGIAFFLIADVAASAQADEFYIVRDLTTQKCTVVNKRPTTDTRTITLATDTIYKSQADAESGMKTIKLCAGNRAE